jgi:hypothetical protein
MSDSGIFIAGVIVTLVWSTAIGLLLWAAFQDGKSEGARKQSQS